MRQRGDTVFNVGDIVTGIVHSPYSVTNDRGKYRVCAAWKQDDVDVIKVAVVEHEHIEFVHMEFTVLAKYFHKVRMVATLK